MEWVYSILPVVIIADAILGFAILVTATIMREITMYKIHKLNRMHQQNLELIRRKNG